MKILLQLSLLTLILCKCSDVKEPKWNVPSSSESVEYNEEISDEMFNKMDICKYGIPSKINFIDHNHSISILKCGEYLAEIELRERRREFNEKCHNNVKKQSTIESTPEYSHMAAVGSEIKSGKFILQCAGALISPNFVLTAYTCYIHPNKNLTNVSANIVRLGTANIMNRYKPAVNIGIKRIIKHPKQNGIYNNLALVELNNAVEFSKYIQPVCLSTVGLNFNRPITVTGWHFRNSKHIDKALVHTLQSGNMSMSKICSTNKMHSKSYFNRQMFCSENINIHGIASCPSKSGGTVQMILNVSKNEGSFYKLLAIMSRPSQNLPNLCESNKVNYIDIKPYIKWIERYVWPEHFK
ncbi:putative serine protease 45 isoform X2 [Pieris rapae]|uniref:putative serine protease 45 isoform X2 n=1 Tax=Pieris rapae TaxID=64459 RepID=UPI001E27FA86|nr:putative serine protease 45 isoform X2 [Pieris rapae]